MAGHIFVVVSGFGKRVIPKAAPYQLSLDDSGSLVVALGGETSVIRADQRSTDAAVADVIAGPDWPAWWLQTTPYRVPLQPGWTAHASGEASPVVFDLVGPRESVMYIQLPRRAPALDQLVAAGQELVDRGAMTAGEWLTARYTHDGLPYLQRHVRVPVGQATAFVTLQCREQDFAAIEAAQRHLVEAILPGDG
jgi:hypothetical protein